MRQETLGGLTVHITGGTDGNGGGDGPVVCLMHGFGAPGKDLVPLGQYLDAPAGTRFVFPEAPLSLAMGLWDARAWWMIDMEELERAVTTGEFRDLSNRVPDGMAQARGLLVAMLNELMSCIECGPQQIVLGGFSQGSMLASEVLWHTKRPFAGLVLLSTTLLAQHEWLPLIPARKGLPVFQSHGHGDPLLPYPLAERYRDHLIEAGLTVDWIDFPGGHEIPPRVLEGLGLFVQRVFAG
jgi:phospholipase/carboxylesterase